LAPLGKTSVSPTTVHWQEKRNSWAAGCDHTLVLKVLFARRTCRYFGSSGCCWTLLSIECLSLLSHRQETSRQTDFVDRTARHTDKIGRGRRGNT
jgi:hypothetical protein